MRQLAILVIVISSTMYCYSELPGGFNQERAKDMAAICNSFTHLDLYNSDEAILPDGYRKLFTSDEIGMDQKFQVYRKGDVGVIHIRGSTEDPMSWMANINSAMIPAEGTLTIDGEPFDYTFAKNPDAAVHSGYALGIGLLRHEILEQIRNLNEQGVYDIILTGHSQGGSLTNLLLAYLANLPNETLTRKNNFKAYAFAAPMVGNQVFVNEYNIRFCEKGKSYNIVNPGDPFTRMPLSYQENEKKMLAENLRRFMSDDESFHFEQMLTEGAALLLQENLDTLVYNTSKRLNRNIERQVGPIDMPARVDDHNYQYLCNKKEIQQVDYPKVLKDSTILEQEELISGYERGPEGHFKKDELYKDEGWGYQHKPYNYYVGFLKTFFPEAYKRLEPKYLPENL